MFARALVITSCLAVFSSCGPLPGDDDGGLVDDAGSTGGGAAGGGSGGGGGGGGGGGAADAGPLADGGVRPDGGTRPDGGIRPDGGTRPDGGIRPDGGVRLDGGLGFTPLTEFSAGQTWEGHPGLLYPGSNQLPAAHLARGGTAAQQVVPLLPDGGGDPAGKMVLLSMGMSNTTQEFCSAAVASDGGPPCTPWSFMGQAAADAEVDRSRLVIVNGARASQVAAVWADPQSQEYDRIRDTRLAPLGLSEAQVQVVWLKVANPQPTISLPDANADAWQLLRSLGAIVRNLQARYPNLRQVFLSSRIFAGFASSPLNPEPYAYESGFAVKWLIEAQLTQLSGGAVDSNAGDLSAAVAPWLAWGPYLWADGLNPRADGLTWVPSDFEADGTHPSPSAEQKVGRLLLEFFKTSPTTRCWFLATPGICP